LRAKGVAIRIAVQLERTCLARKDPRAWPSFRAAPLSDGQGKVEEIAGAKKRIC